MKVVTRNLPDSLERHLESWRQRAFANVPARPQGGRFLDRGGASYATSEELLRRIDWNVHDGYPVDSYDYPFTGPASGEFGERLDEAMQREIGYRKCALKAVYPIDGYFAWHDNRNASGLNVLLCWSDEESAGYWRHVEPDTGRIVTIRDCAGWSMKMGLYGRDAGTRLRHCAAASSASGRRKRPGIPTRCTIGYIVDDENMWDDIMDEYGDEE